MLSKAYTHYPQFRFRDHQKLLWNPVLKKTFKVRPEERIRLQLVDYLTLSAGFSASRLSFESPVKLQGEKSLSRTDLIGYNPGFKPHLLVECKAPEINLNEKAALQIARYNRQVGAPVLLVTNGLLDFWYEIEGDSIQQLSETPAPYSSSEDPLYSFDYWEQRAFAGRNTKSSLHEFITSSCSFLFKNPLKSIQFLRFEGMPRELALDHYYRVFNAEGNQPRLALSFSANIYGGTRLNGILNRDGANTGFFSTSLDLLYKGEPDNTHLQSARGTYSLDLAAETSFQFETNIAESISSMKDLLIENS